jgi:hypothetical protein
MKILFTFTDIPDLASLSKDDIYTTAFDVPDAALELPDCKERVVQVAELVSRFTTACLFISAKELGLTQHPIKTNHDANGSLLLYLNSGTMVVLFESFNRGRGGKIQVKILAPITPPMAQPYLMRRGKRAKEKHSLAHNLKQLGTYWCKTQTDLAYAADLEKLSQALITLLNTDISLSEHNRWQCRGFHPWWTDNGLIIRHRKQSKKRELERQKAEKDTERQRLREAKLKEQGVTPSQTPQSGAGRTYGARPGKFMGVQMRSQLEIRFAAELQEREIQWVYEGEVLGEGGYLVDFYLPELETWVEVKGQLTARDNLLLKEVAAYLKSERKQRLLVFMQNKALVVNPSGFREIKLDEFWRKLLT